MAPRPVMGALLHWFPSQLRRDKHGSPTDGVREKIYASLKSVLIEHCRNQDGPNASASSSNGLVPCDFPAVSGPLAAVKPSAVSGRMVADEPSAVSKEYYTKF